LNTYKNRISDLDAYKKTGTSFIVIYRRFGILANLGILMEKYDLPSTYKVVHT